MSTNVYQMVTDRIIAELEKGSIPWKRPLTGVNTGAYNRISNKPYSLLNQILLGRDGEWATFKQWTDLGGHIRKGEKSSFVVFWKIQPYEDINADGEKVVKQIPLLRYYNVFHISQVERVKPLEDVKLNDIEPIAEVTKSVNTSELLRQLPMEPVMILLWTIYKFLAANSTQTQMNFIARYFMKWFTGQAIKPA